MDDGDAANFPCLLRRNKVPLAACLVPARPQVLSILRHIPFALLITGALTHISKFRISPLGTPRGGQTTDYNYDVGMLGLVILDPSHL